VGETALGCASAATPPNKPPKSATPPEVLLITFTGLGIDPGQRMYLSEQLLREQSEAKRVMFDALAGSVTDGEHRVLDHASHSWLHIEAARRRRLRDPRLLGKMRP
jgi:hypothetical protein